MKGKLEGKEKKSRGTCLEMYNSGWRLSQQFQAGTYGCYVPLYICFYVNWNVHSNFQNSFSPVFSIPMEESGAISVVVSASEVLHL
jgi:hypothetical protein